MSSVNYLVVHFSDKCCANCNEEFSTETHKLTGFTSQSRTVTNFHALSSIFKAELKMNTGKKDSNAVPIPMCLKCTLSLASLHRSFMEFMDLSSKASSLQQLIRNTSSWIDKQHRHSCGQFSRDKSRPSTSTPQRKCQGTNKSSKIVKSEPKETEEIEVLPDFPVDDDDFFGTLYSHADNSLDRDNNLKKSTAEILKLGYSTSTTRSKTLSKLAVRIEPLELEKMEMKTVEIIGPNQSISSRHTYLINKQQERKKRQLLLRRRKKTEERKKPISKTKVCGVCSKVFRDNHGLRQHTLVHIDEKKFKCTDCPRAYKQQKLLTRHMNVKHGVGGKLPDRTCNICGLYFSVPHVLKNHMKSVHATEKPFCCDICGRRFPTYNYLNIHMKMRHKDDDIIYKYKCDLCEKLLSTKTGLQTHMEMVHLKEKKFACLMCPGKFYRMDWLRDHMKIHEEHREKSFKCKYCDATFFSRNNARTHEKKHTIGQDKLCSQCGTGFKNKSSLIRHIASRHTDGESLSCELCGKTFKLREYLLQHMRSKTHGGLGHYAERLKNGTTKRAIGKIEPLLSSTPSSEMAVQQGRISTDPVFQTIVETGEQLLIMDKQNYS